MIKFLRKCYKSFYRLKIFITTVENNDNKLKMSYFKRILNR